MLLLITGASGVGKSTVRAVVAPELSPQVESVELRDLAPSIATRLGWRQQAAEIAVRRAVELQASGRHLLLAGDPVPAIEVIAAPSAPQLDALAVCLLDVSAEAQAARLAARGDDPTLLVHHRRSLSGCVDRRAIRRTCRTSSLTKVGKRCAGSASRTWLIAGGCTRSIPRT